MSTEIASQISSSYLVCLDVFGVQSRDDIGQENILPSESDLRADLTIMDGVPP